MEEQAFAFEKPSTLGNCSTEMRSPESRISSPDQEWKEELLNNYIQRVFGGSIWELLEENCRQLNFSVIVENPRLKPSNEICMNDLIYLLDYDKEDVGNVNVHFEIRSEYHGNISMTIQYNLKRTPSSRIPIRYGYKTEHDFIMFLLDFNVPIASIERPVPQNEYTDTIQFLNDLEEFQIKQFEENLSNKRKKNIESLIASGIKFWKMGNGKKAEIYMELVTEIDKSNTSEWQRLGIFHAENKKITCTIENFNESLKLQPNNQSVIRCLALCHLSNNDLVETYRMFMELLKRNPKYKDIVDSTPLPDEKKIDKNLLIKQLNQPIKDMYTDAIQRNEELEKNDVDVYFNFGIFHYINNDYDEAIVCFDDALKIDPKNVFIWSSLGAAFAKLRKYEKSTEAYREAIRLNPGFVKARYNLGHLCIYFGFYREATDHFIIALNYQEVVKNNTAQRNALWENIWISLKLAVSVFKRPDLSNAVEIRDMEFLNYEFLQIRGAEDYETNNTDYIIKYLTKQ